MGDHGRIFSLTGRRALVTGGSVSIGRAIALAFAEAGADVAIQYYAGADKAFGLSDAAAATCRDIEALGRACTAVEADFAHPGAAGEAAVKAGKALGGIDILVIAASIQKRQAFGDIGREDMLSQSQVNLFSTFELLQSVLPRMVENGWGRVLSIGSVNETRPEGELSVYAALKAAQANLIANLARQHAGTGVTLNTLAPGLVATERNRWRREDADDWARIQSRANPMGRAGTIDDMVGAALLLCSPASDFITGANLQATGGGHL
ncbi:MAG: SDR family oxidoreductase [Rhizobium sp.]|nr:MAG: SDR family oxidoreductase [Rhizobium sp.]